ncbi:hypothetical protein HY485_00060 [Candidatus Woesearchaeota archaeon]|nr:hypothetical protein [Candidatus Woesearchaeota archaeon]
MNEKMFIHWDAEGDFLEVRFGKPTPSFYDDLGNDVFERKDEKTNQVKGYAFFNVIKKMKKEPQDIAINLSSLNEAMVST